MRWRFALSVVVAALIVVSVAGLIFAAPSWLPNAAVDLAACQLQAQRFYQTFRANDLNDPSSPYIVGCMESQGYEFSMLLENCDGRHPLANQAACYTPTSWFGAMLDRYSRTPKQK